MKNVEDSSHFSYIHIDNVLKCRTILRHCFFPGMGTNIDGSSFEQSRLYASIFFIGKTSALNPQPQGKSYMLSKRTLSVEIDIIKKGQNNSKEALFFQLS